jgi:TRAP-type C4-dicarboxylate transport system permease small subunit
MVWVSADFTLQIYNMEQKSDAAEIPMWLPHLSVVVGFVGMLLCSFLELKTLLTQRVGSSTRA